MSSVRQMSSSGESQFGSSSLTTPLWGGGRSSRPLRVKYCEESKETDKMLKSSTSPDTGRKKESNVIGFRTLAAFWILGLCNNYGYVVMLTAAHDILSGHDDNADHPLPTPPPDNSTVHRHCNPLSTGAILLADIIPSLFIKSIAPFFPLAIHFRMVLILLLSSSGFILVAEAANQWVAIAGVVLTALSSGLGEASLLSYMAFYKNKNVISTWSSGTGGAGFFGSFTYTGFTNIFKMTRSSTLYSLLTVPALMAFSFWFLLEKPDIQFCSDQTVPTEEGGGSTGSVKPPTTRSQSDDINQDGDEYPLTSSQESFFEKLYSLPMLWKFMIPMGLVYLFEYLINQGLFELVQFPLDWLSYQDQYKWYQVTYQIGVFLSRSSTHLITIRRTWILALLQGLNVILFSTEAVYAYLPSIYIILVAVLWEGLLGGAAYVNTYRRIALEVPVEKQEFSMAFTSLSDAIGISLAGFLAIPVHNSICSMG